MAFMNWIKKNNADDEFDDLDEEFDNSYYEPDKKNDGDKRRSAASANDGYVDYDDDARQSDDNDRDVFRPLKPKKSNGYVVPPYTSIPEDGEDYVDMQPEDRSGERVVASYDEPETGDELYFVPVNYADFIHDSGEIVAGLQEKHPILICLRKLDKLSIMRVYDFTTGLAMGLDSDVFRMGSASIVLCPEGRRINVNDLTVPAEFLSDAEDEEEDA